MGQTGLEIYNKELATANAEGKDINPFLSVGRGMFSPEGIEAGLQGFFGGGGLKGTAYSAKALNNIRKSNKELDVEQELSNLVILTKRYNQSKDSDVKEALDKEIKSTKKLLKNKIKKGNDLYNSLSNNDIKEIENLSDLADVAAFRTNQLIERFKEGEISEEDFNLAIKGLSDQYNKNKDGIIDILYKRNLEFAKTEAKKIGKEVVEIQTKEEFQQEYDKIRGEEDFEGDVTDTDGFIKGNKIYINALTAKESEAISVGSHELLHGVIGNYIDKLSDVDRVKLGKQFISTLNSKQQDAVRRRLKENYGLEGDAIYSKTGVNEMFTVLSDAVEKGEVTFNETFGQQLKFALQDFIRAIIKAIPGIEVDYNKEFGDGRQAYNFLKEYNKNIKEGKLGKKALAFAKQTKEAEGVKFIKESRSKAVNAVNKMEKGAKTQDEFRAKERVVGADGKTKVLPSPFDNVYNSIIKEDGAINNYVKSLRLSKEKFQETIEAVSDRLINYDPAAERKTDSGEPITVGEFLMANIGYGKLVAAKKLAIKGEKEGKTTRIDAAKKTKEGETTFDIEDTDASTQEILDEQDMSVEGIAKREAKEAKAKKKRNSKLRQELGFETDGDAYNKVLDSARKSLLLAYKKTTNIKDPKARVDKIVELIKKEYNSLTSDLFKPLKNFLGVKDYLNNLKTFKEAIIEAVSTADLVQMERNIPDADKVFVVFERQLTTKKEVQDAIDKNLLPKDDLNRVSKGPINLYKKVMPTDNEIVGFADQPAINPETGQRSGLKGTRKDGFAKRIAETLILDAIMEVRQETEVQQTLTEDLNVEMDVQQLASKIGRDVDVKFSKSNAVADIDNAVDVGTDTGVYLQVRFSKSHREQYENRLKKNRTDLSEEQRKNAVQSIFDFVDKNNIPNNKKAKLEKLALHYMANGYLILPEDGYKVIEAERVATIKKLDAFSYKNPNVLLEENVVKEKVKRTNPDTVETFSNKTEYSDGVVVYDVEDSKQGQRDVRKVIDTHFGKNANPWCLCAREKQENIPDSEIVDTIEEAETMKIAFEESGRYESVEIIPFNWKQPDGPPIPQFAVEARLPRKEKFDELGQAWSFWKNYNQDGEGLGFRIAFHNGELVGFRDGKKSPRWWDRMDKPSDAPMIKGKKGKDGYRTVSLAYRNKTIPQYLEKVTGDNKNGTTIKKDLDGTVINIESKKDGAKHGKQFQRKDDRSAYYTQEMYEVYDKGNRTSFKEVRIYKDYKGESGKESFSNGRDELTLNNITKYERSYTHPVLGPTPGSANIKDYTETTIVEGTIDQKYFKEFNDPSSAEGFVKTNLKYTTPAHERYYSRQGEKITLVIKKGETQSVTINGEVQETRARFSRSAINKVEHDILKGKNSVKNKNLQQHLYNFLARVNNQGKELTDEEIQVISEELSYIVPGKGVKKGYIMPERDRKLFVVIAKDLQNRNKYAKIDDPNLLSELIKDIVEARGKFNVGTALESKNKKILDSATSGELTDGPGDVYFVYDNGVVVGIESKAKDSQAVSQRVSNTKEGLSFPNKNETTNENNDLIDDVVIGGEIKNMHNKVNEFLVENNRKEIKDFSQELESDIARLLKENKEKFQGETEVDLIYVTSHMVTGRFQKSPQSIVSSEGDINTMESFDKDGNPTKSYALAIRIAEIFNNNIKDSKRQIKPLKLKEGKKVKVLISFEVTDKGEIKQRVRPQLKFKDFESSTVNIFKDKQAAEVFGKAIDQAASESKFSISKQAVLNTRPVLKYSKTSRGMSAFDFDETLIDKGENFILATSPNGVELKISSGQWPIEGPKLASEGYTFDFKDFVNVRGGVDGPLLQKLKNRIKKYGAKNNYILTARPPESATAIHGWLKTRGINIPLENITGLGNSTGEAKALWIADKYSQGYNDIYFVDDALPNVKAVADVINQLDIKGKSVQARVKFSKSLDKDFNDIIEDVKGIESGKRFSVAKGRARGQGKGRFRLFIPPSHEDFVGLLYNFIGFGEKGNKHRDFFEKALIKPLNRAYRELNVAKQAIANDYRALVKSMPEVRKRLGEKILKSDYTVEDAIRVYLFDKAGYEVPGLTKTDLKNLTNFVKENSDILQFAEQVGKISRVEEGYISPGDSWQASNIRYDLVDATGRVGRAKFFTEYQENADIIFSDENMNKIRAAFGDNFVEALKDMLHVNKTGSNRPTGNNRIVNRFLDWINGSVGATMFFNARSAVLQTLSTVNFINFGDNNIFKAAAAFANQKQYWSDFAALFNSDYLKQRRAGAAFDVNANEIAREVAGSKNPVLAAIKYLLNIGFLPTQLADSFAIASGGATFYRNRIKTYLKQGLSQQEAESKAFIDFQEISEATQQSARPDMVSQQQRSPLGRVILAFQNVTAQYARLIKKATLDLVNRRRSRGYQTQIQSDMSNISRIIYYGVIQAVIFNALQNALFAMMFDEDEEDEKKTEKFFDTKKQRVINGTIDSLLKGLGVGGAVLATLKNYAIKLSENLEDDSFFKEPPSYELLQVSPPIGIKIRKIRRAEKNLEWNKDVLTELPLDNLDNPIYETSANYIEGFTNIPVARLLRKVQNISAALDSQNKWWQRIAVGLGWSRWDVGIKDNEIKEAKKAIRENNKRINKETKLKKATPEEKLKIIEKEIFDLNKSEQVKILEANNLNPKKYPKEADRVSAIMKLRKKNKTKIDSTINAIENYIPTEKEQRSIDLFKMNKKDQVNMLIDLGLSSKQIKKLKYEEDRVNKIIEIQNKSKK